MSTNIAEPIDGTEILQITHGIDFEIARGDGRELLFGFWFGEGSPGKNQPQVAAIGLHPINRPALFEGWWYSGPVHCRQSGSVRIAECKDYTAVLIQKAETDRDDLRTLAREAYVELYSSLLASKHKNIVRIWNYFGDINRGEGDLERYRQFSIGRAEAFEEMGLSDEFSPAGTAIGTLSGNVLSVIALASNNDFKFLENPRQISAYSYPRQYGPSSPKFSRGGVISVSDHHLFLISGTAAIIGHESAHPGDAAEQTRETLRNIESLLASSSWSDGGRQSKAMRVYLRNEEDYPQVAQILAQSFTASDLQFAFLCGDICRKELLVEIDGAYCRD